jgi:hypothetical protein
MSEHSPTGPRHGPGTTDHHRSMVSVPRIWLGVLTVLFVAPWIGLASWWWSGGSAPVAEDPLPALADEASETVGAWGELVITPIAISPPIEYVSRDWGELQPSVWHFPPVTGDELESRLVSLGLDQADASRLRSTARSSPLGGLFVTPDAELVGRLAPDVRARIYIELARIGVRAGGEVPLNYDQQTAYRYYGSSIDEWLGTGLLSPETRQLIDPYFYRYNDFLFFADIEQVRSRIHDADELQRLAKRLLRQATMLVELRVPEGAAVASIAEYWGRGGRRTDLVPLLESVARGGPERATCCRPSLVSTCTGTRVRASKTCSGRSWPTASGRRSTSSIPSLTNATSIRRLPSRRSRPTTSWCRTTCNWVTSSRLPMPAATWCT